MRDSANTRDSGERGMDYGRLLAERLMAMDNGTGILIVDSAFRIVEISRSILLLFEEAGGQPWAGRPVEEWFRAAGWTPEPFDRSLLYGVLFRDRTLTCQVKDTRRSFMLDGDVLVDPGGGGAAGAFVLLRDVTHLVQLEEQIRRADRLKTIGQIAAGTAHEIRNPLTAMRGFMQLLGKSLADQDRDKELGFVEVMLTELDRVNELVSEFLLLSKPKEEKLAAVRAADVLREILPVIRNEAHLYGTVVEYETPRRELPPVWVDKEQLKQVVLNLAKNAIEAMVEGGTLILRIFDAPDRTGWIALSVRDSGPGIPPEALERIFDPFFTTKAQGTGLGLSICQRIVHDLGGDLEVDTGPDGSSFTVWLPQAAASGGRFDPSGGALPGNVV